MATGRNQDSNMRMNMFNCLSVATYIACSACALQAASWPAFRGNMQRTGYVPVSVDMPDSAARWVRKLGAGIVSSPAVAGGTLYVGARDNNIYAIDAASGAIRWKTETQDWIESSPLIDGDRVIAGSLDGKMYSLDAATGKVRATFDAGVQVSSPVKTTDGAILATIARPLSGEGALGSFPTASGETSEPVTARWTLPFGQISHSSPALSGQYAVAGASNGNLYCVNVSTRKIIWTLRTTGDVNLSTPAIDNQTVYFSPGDGWVYALDLATGTCLWKNGDRGSGSLPKLSNGMQWVDARSFKMLLSLSPTRRSAAVRTMSASGIVFPRVFDDYGLAKTRASLSMADFYPYGTIRSSSVAVGPEAIYVTMKETGYPSPKFTLRAIDRRSGTLKWFFSEMPRSDPSWYCSSPLVTGNMVFAGWGEGKIYGFDSRSGEIRWSRKLSADIISSPVLADGMLYAATMDGNVYCFNVVERALGSSIRRPQLVGSKAGMRFQFGLNEPGHVRIQLYAINGRLIKTLVDETMSPGDHFVSIDKTQSNTIRMAAATYLIRATIVSNTYIFKMIMTR